MDSHREYRQRVVQSILRDRKQILADAFDKVERQQFAADMVEELHTDWVKSIYRVVTLFIIGLVGIAVLGIYFST